MTRLRPSDSREPRRLVALDIDGTVLHEDGSMSPRVWRSVRAAEARGHEVTLATGRSVATTLPVLDRLGLTPEYVVCSNGAITVRRGDDGAYRREWVETFDPSDVLLRIRDALAHAQYAVEDETGYFRYTKDFPSHSVGETSEQVSFEQLLGTPATRLVVISPNHGTEDFLGIVERMGLHRVSYSVGWTAWLDIAPDGVNKATAVERVRRVLEIPRGRVVAVGDGRNDLEMLRWAAANGGVGAAMGQAPDDVREIASVVTGTIAEDGLAQVLEGIA